MILHVDLRALVIMYTLLMCGANAAFLLGNHIYSWPGDSEEQRTMSRDMGTMIKCTAVGVLCGSFWPFVFFWPFLSVAVP